MKIKIWLISAVLISALTSCDDGDLIVTSFDFEDQNLEFCGGESSFVFYKINNDAQESIALNIAIVSEIFLEEEIAPINLSSTNFVSYRKFNGDVDASYFCSSIPPVSPQVSTEYLAESGIAILTNTLVLDDQDRVPKEMEFDDGIGGLLDTDLDGIPNYYDSDDDGDNVPTTAELSTEPDPDGDDGNPLTPIKDTDLDGIPDYLDKDDDGDGIDTINESTDGDNNPLNDMNDPMNPATSDFLNNDITISGATITTFISHSYTRNSSVLIVLSNLVLTNEDETIIQESLNLGTKTDVINDTFTFTPIFVED